MAQSIRKARSLSVSKRISEMGLGPFAEFAFVNQGDPANEVFDQENPPKLMREHITRVPTHVFGSAFINDLVYAVTTNVLHTNNEGPVFIKPKHLDYWTTPQPCHVCCDEEREPCLCVVATTLDVRAIEEDGEFSGFYHVLGSLPAVTDEAAFAALVERIKFLQPDRLFLALGQDEKGKTAEELVKAAIVAAYPALEIVAVEQHERRADAEAAEDGKLPCPTCGKLVPTVIRVYDPLKDPIPYCHGSKCCFLVHDDWLIPCDQFDAWCETFEHSPKVGLNEDILKLIRAGLLDIYDFPYSHHGYDPSDRNFRLRYFENIDLIFSDVRTSKPSDDESGGYKPYASGAARLVSGYCGSPGDPMGRGRSTGLTHFFFGFISKTGGWIVFVPIGVIYALCAAYSADMVDGTFARFLKKEGLIVPKRLLRTAGDESRDNRQRGQRRPTRATRPARPETAGGDTGDVTVVPTPTGSLGTFKDLFGGRQLPVVQTPTVPQPASDKADAPTNDAPTSTDTNN